MVGLVFILIVAIICITILCALYMVICNDNGEPLFIHPEYEKRIAELEKKVKALEDK